MAPLSMADFGPSYNNSVYIESARRRINARITVTAAGCWECSLSISQDGYSTVWFANRTWRTHRLLWLLDKGEIPEGLVTDHLCRNRKCCNLDHIELVTNAENLRRGNSGPKTPKAKPAPRPKDHCQRGHRLSDYNAEGKRYCPTCNRERGQAWAASLSPEARAARTSQSAACNRRKRRQP